MNETNQDTQVGHFNPFELIKDDKANGRPTAYTRQLAMEILVRIANGESLRSICKDERMPSRSTVALWRIGDVDGFSDHYARAREMQVENMFEEIIEIADDGSNDMMEITRGKETYDVENKEVTSRSKLRVETRKWYMSKVMPKIYGDKFDVTSDGEKITGNKVQVMSFRDIKLEEEYGD